MRDGAKVHAWVIGTGPSCMLLHGFGADSRFWIPFIYSMSRRYRFILPDLRGFGRSRAAPVQRDRAITQYVEDIDDLLDALGCREAKLGGLSMGAYICLHKQRVNQLERISRCVVMDHPSEPITRDDWPYGMNPYVTDVSQQLVECFEENNLSDPDVPFAQLPLRFQQLYKAVHRAIAIYSLPRRYQKWCAQIALRVWPYRFWPYFKTFVLSLPWHATTTCLADYLSPGCDMRPYLRNIKIPFTIWMGARSEMFPNEGIMYLKDHIRNSKLVTFEYSGHGIFLTEPIKFHRELKKFVEE